MLEEKQRLQHEHALLTCRLSTKKSFLRRVENEFHLTPSPVPRATQPSAPVASQPPRSAFVPAQPTPTLGPPPPTSELTEPPHKRFRPQDEPPKLTAPTLGAKPTSVARNKKLGVTYFLMELSSAGAHEDVFSRRVCHARDEAASTRLNNAFTRVSKVMLLITRAHTQQMQAVGRMMSTTAATVTSPLLLLPIHNHTVFLVCPRG